MQTRTDEEVMNLREYMSTLRELKFTNCEHLKYDHSDNDCGYRSGLTFLRLRMTDATDKIAHEMIYGDDHDRLYKPPRMAGQLDWLDL